MLAAFVVGLTGPECLRIRTVLRSRFTCLEATTSRSCFVHSYAFAVCACPHTLCVSSPTQNRQHVSMIAWGRPLPLCHPPAPSQTNPLPPTPPHPLLSDTLPNPLLQVRSFPCPCPHIALPKLSTPNMMAGCRLMGDLQWRAAFTAGSRRCCLCTDRWPQPLPRCMTALLGWLPRAC